MQAKIPDSNKAAIYRKFLHLQTLTGISSEFPKLNEWIRCAMDIPFQKIEFNIRDSKSQCQYLDKVNSKLNKEIYGLKNVKEQLLFNLNNKIDVF